MSLRELMFGLYMYNISFLNPGLHKHEMLYTRVQNLLDNPV